MKNAINDKGIISYHNVICDLQALCLRINRETEYSVDFEHNGKVGCIYVYIKKAKSVGVNLEYKESVYIVGDDYITATTEVIKIISEVKSFLIRAKTKGNILALDTETTGLDPKRNALTQVAAIWMVDGVEKSRISLNINPYSFGDWVEVTKEALKITGKTEEMLREYSNQSEAFGRFMESIPDIGDERWQVIGYNTPFDTKFIKDWMRLNEVKYGAYISYAEIDVLALARHMKLWGMLPLDSLKLGNLCEHYGIELDAHNAMNDIKVTMTVYDRMREEIGK